MRKRAALITMICLAFLAAPRTCPAINLYLEHAIPGGCEKITALAFSPAGGKVLYGTGDGKLVLVDLETGKGNIIYAGGGREITAAAISPDGRFAAMAPKGKAALLLGIEGGTALAELKETKGRITVLEFSGDGRYLAAGGDKKEIVVWEVPSGQLRSTLKGHTGEVLAIAFHETEGSIISAGRDRKMIIWDAATGKPLRRHDLEARTITGSGIDVTSARVGPNRLYVAVAVEEHILQKGGLGGTDASSDKQAGTGGGQTLRQSGSGPTMIFKYHLAFFDVSKGALLKVLENNRHRIDHIGLYPGNCFVAFDNSTLQEHSFALRNIESGDLDLAYPMQSECALLEFSPDGRWLAGAAAPSGGAGDARLCLWKVDYEIPASGCFMGRIRLTSTGDPVLKRGGKRLAAVLPFAAGEGDENLGRAAGNFIESRLSANPNLRLIERARVDDLVKELKLQKSGLVDKSNAVKAGKMLGATLMITGTIDRVGADLVVSARVIDVQTGEILGSKQVHCGQCGADDIFDAIAVLAPALIEE
jgi:WD40 repeat protein/TolB-like protein